GVARQRRFLNLLRQAVERLADAAEVVQVLVDDDTERRIARRGRAAEGVTAGDVVDELALVVHLVDGAEDHAVIGVFPDDGRSEVRSRLGQYASAQFAGAVDDLSQFDLLEVTGRSSTYLLGRGRSINLSRARPPAGRGCRG